ncbi:pilus assembly protein PilP [Salinimonas chungwhensis]|uniref:pilus assembly protein PilP n=1 Tax=Salinimonas chungwhensis TaxID=265425 RepID=UPI000375E194|nr:pilus assembly protein PilP [Salinimonas chungwhensis]
MKLSNVIFPSLCVGLLSACAPQLDDLTTYTNQIKQKTQVRIEPYPEFSSQPAFQYSSADRRSPFKRPVDRSEPLVTKRQTNCLQPDYDRKKESLEQYGLDALAYTGSFKSQGTEWVLFKTADGSLLKGTKGSRIGLFYGTIQTINRQSVKIEQLLPDGAGCWQREETTLTLATPAGENNNV